MNMPVLRRREQLLALLVALAVPPLLLLGSARLLLTETYLRLEYHRPDFPPDPYGFTLEDRLKFAPAAVNYLLGAEEIDYLRGLRLPDGRVLFNERELSHMDDVRGVVQWTLSVLILVAVVSAAVVALLARTADGRQALRHGLLGGGLLMLALLAALLAYLLLDWDHFFDAFHDLFFAEGTWRFYYTDSLIRLFPIRFWQDAALTLGGLSGGGALLLVAICWLWERRAAEKT